MSDLVAGLLLLAGGAFSLLGAVGITRMPDVLTRLQASTKAGTLGVACLLAGAAIHFATLEAGIRALLAVSFLFLTAPVAAHMISRAAHRARTKLWSGMGVDELREDAEAAAKKAAEERRAARR